MLRLITTDEIPCQHVAPRLRRAAIDVCGPGEATARLPTCDSVLLLHSERRAVEFAGQCLAAGKHVLLAASAWLTSDALDALVYAATTAGAHFCVANPGQFLPSRRLIRDQLESGKLGTPGLIRLHHWETRGPADSEATPELPNSLLLDLDLALWLAGKTPNLVYAVGAQAGKAQSAGSYIQVHLGFPGGAAALLDYSNRLPPGDGYQSLSVIGASGAAYADDQQNMQLVYRGGAPQAMVVKEDDKQWTPLVQDFVDGLQASRDFTHSIAAWRTVLRVAAAVQYSLELRQSVATH